MDILRNLQSNPFAWLAISSLTIIGFWLTYKSTQQKVIKYYLESKKMENGLTETRIVFWNSSSNAISESDLPEHYPFCAFTIAREIVDACVERGGGLPNEIRVEEHDKKIVAIYFEFLNRGQGGEIKVTHTGGLNEIYIGGIIVGGKIRKAHFKKKIEKYTL